MTKGFTYNKYRQMLIASLLGWIVCIVGGLADSLIGGMCISEDAVAAVGLVSPLLGVVFFLSILLAIGVSGVFSIYSGAFDRKSAKRAAGMGIVLAVIVGILQLLVMFVLEDAYFEFYSTTPAIEALARDYYETVMTYALVYPIYWVFYYLVYIDGNSTLCLIADIVSAVVNIVMSFILVGPFGIRGIAMGTVISLVASGLMLIFHFTSKKNSIRFKFCFDWKLFKQVVAVGSPASLSYLYIGVIDVVMNKFIIANFGDTYLSAYAIINLVLNLAGALHCGMDAASPFVGVSYGEKNDVTMKRVVKIATRTTIIVSAVLAAIIIIFSGSIPEIYGITTPEAIKASTYALIVLGLSYPLAGFTAQMVEYLSKIEQTFLSNATECIYDLVGPLVLATTFGLLWGFKGMVWGFFASAVASAAFVTIFILIKYGKDRFPFIIKNTEDQIFVHEYMLNNGELKGLSKTIDSELKEIGLEDNLINKLEMLFEESMNIIKEQNPDKKKILCDCTIMVNADRVKLITRDNGKVFDITKIDENNSLFDLVAARLMKDSSDSQYMTSVSFNRNQYIWNR